MGLPTNYFLERSLQDYSIWWFISGNLFFGSSHIGVRVTGLGHLTESNALAETVAKATR